MTFSHYLRIIFVIVHFTNAFCLSFGNKKDTSHYLKLDKLEACEGTLNTSVVYHPAQVFLNDNEATVNYNITVKKQISSDLESVWIIEKCASKESLDSCQQFYKMRSARFCQFLGVKGEVWSSFIDCTTPRFQCPFKKGFYIGKNCKLDLSLFKLFPIQNSYWRTKIIVNDIKTKTLVSCASMQGGLAKL